MNGRSLENVRIGSACAVVRSQNGTHPDFKTTVKQVSYNTMDIMYHWSVHLHWLSKYKKHFRIVSLMPITLNMPQMKVIKPCFWKFFCGPLVNFSLQFNFLLIPNSINFVNEYLKFQVRIYPVCCSKCLVQHFQSIKEIILYKNNNYEALWKVSYRKLSILFKPLNFIPYTADATQLFTIHDFKVQMYVDNSQAYLHCCPAEVLEAPYAFTGHLILFVIVIDTFKPPLT